MKKWQEICLKVMFAGDTLGTTNFRASSPCRERGGPMYKSLIVLSLMVGTMSQIQQSTPDKSVPKANAYASQREALMATGNAAMEQKRYAEALEQYRKVLVQYPDDLRVLMATGYAAWAAGDLDDAATYFRRCDEIPHRYPWSVRFSLLQLNAALGRWNEFSQEQAVLEKAAIGGDPAFQNAINDGFRLERFKIGSQHLYAIDYPQPDRAGGARYRFRLGGKPVSDAVFVPHIDLVEQREGFDHFVLKQCSEPQKEEVIKSYLEHEPAYQNVREVVLRLLQAQLGTTDVHQLLPFSK
jgi:tetratricopeptide (TPR) repeat protein